MTRRVNGARARPQQKRPSAHIPVSRARRVKPLLKFLKAWGRGSEGVQSRKEFAKRIGTTLAYLVHLAYGYRVASIEMAIKIEQATHGLVKREDMRPDIKWSDFAPRPRAPQGGAPQRAANAVPA